MSGPPTITPRFYVGIDPGFEGAIGVIDVRSRYNRVWDMPTRGDEGRGREVDVAELLRIIGEIDCSGRVVGVFLEWPQTRPDEAPEASKRFGVGLGNLEAAFMASGHTVTRVAPNKWKGRLGLSGKAGDSAESREAAVRMAEEFILEMPPGTLRGPRGGALDGRAEALLIAWEAMTCTREGLEGLDSETRLARVMFGSGRRRRGRGYLT
jgi:hypothetical protein